MLAIANGGIIDTGADVIGLIRPAEGLVLVSINVHMRTVSFNDHAGWGKWNMQHLREYRAAAGGKLHVDNSNKKSLGFTFMRRMIFAIATVLAASTWGSPSHAQAGGPFAGMAGVWSGTGTVTLDDGSTERIRCRATYAVGAGGNGLQQTLLCASDSYKFNLSSNVTAQGSAITGTWSEASRNINGNIEGRSSPGTVQVLASAPGFAANISVTTHGNKQSVVIKAESQFKGASISLTRS